MPTLIIAALALVGCGPEPQPVASAFVELPAPRLLRRMSLDLRGTLPSVEELDAVEADHGQLAVVRDAYLEDPLFEERLVQIFAERWHTRVDEYLITYLEYQELAYDEANEFPFEKAVGEEPLRLMARIVADDRPWSDVVTSDYTVANELLADIWPIDYPVDGSGWQEARYTDGRPAAGVLATNGLWWRYFSTFSNYNRGRVAAISRLLLCEDYLARPVSLTAGGLLVGGDDIEGALRSNPYCQGCHSSLDPAAAAMFGFWPVVVYNADELHTYHPDRELLGEEVLDVEMAWMGQPIDGLAGLGLAVAQDARFARCAAQTTAESLWGRDTELDDFDRVDGLRQVYALSGGRLKAVFRAVTESPEYRAGALSDVATPTESERTRTVRMMTSALLQSAVGEVSGFTWTADGFELLANDTVGHRVLGGGVDGVYLKESQQVPGASWALVVRRVAEAAASHAAQVELTEGDSGAGLLSEVDLAARPGEPTFEHALALLHWRLLAQRPTDAWMTDAQALWSALESSDGAAAAWAGLLAALLQDPTFSSY